MKSTPADAGSSSGTDAAPAPDARIRPDASLRAELDTIRRLDHAARTVVRAGSLPPLPGNALFLADGRVVCRERTRGDSRVPYGRDGFNFWVTAAGRMHANNGLYFLFLPTSEGQDPPIAFFGGFRRPEEPAFQPVSLLPTPWISGADTAASGHWSEILDRYTVLGRDAAYFIVEARSFRTAVRVFVHQTSSGTPLIVFSVRLENHSSADLEAYQSAFMNPFCRRQYAETHEDRWFKKVELGEQSSAGADNGAAHLPPFHISVNEDVSRFHSITNRALVRRSLQFSTAQPNDVAGSLLDSAVCTSHRCYLGSPRRSLATCAFLDSGEFAETPPLTVFNDNAVVGDLQRLHLPAGAAVECYYVASFPVDDAALAVESQRSANSAAVEALLTESRHIAASRGGQLRIEVGETEEDCPIHPGAFNHFIPFLVYQVEVCGQLRGYMQPSPNSLIGIRDVFQALEGQLFDDAAAARQKMLEALDYVLVDGRCPRQYSLPVNGAIGRADLREFVDQGSWVISTLHTYVSATGDASILAEQVGYHAVNPQDESALVRSEERDSVLDHLVRILDFLDRKRDSETRLLRALYGDWNDALDGLGTSAAEGVKFGSGVSVMATLQLYQNCGEMIELLERFGNKEQQSKIAAVERMRDVLRDGLLEFAVVRQGDERRILHGWGDKRAYQVGGFADSDGLARDGLTSNAFWALAGMLSADPTLKPDILRAMMRLDSSHGLRTFAPGFEPDAPGVGRMPKLPIGTAENGASYIHATVFGVMALFAMGEPRRAWEQIIKVLPLADHHQGISHSPFVMPNSYVENAELNLTGQNMNDWQTGSSNVLLKTLIRDVFGFRPGFDSLRIVPAAWSPFRTMRMICRAHARRLTIEIAGSPSRTSTFTLNGEPLKPTWDATRQTPSVEFPYNLLRKDAENLLRIN